MENKISYFFDEIFENFHKTSRSNSYYVHLDQELKEFISKSNFAPNKSGIEEFGPFGSVNLKYIEMGAITSLDLFGLDELIIFAFYWKNRINYKNVCDIGANIGLHSILMSKCGWNVNSFEPDPVTAKIFENNINANSTNNIQLNRMAVSGFEGSAEFTRVTENTTGSHLSGAKENPYGQLDKFSVPVRDIKKIMPNSDLIKLDVEGEEAKVILSTDKDHWKNCDMMLEVGSSENAKLIFNHLNNLGINMFSQKKSWKKVELLSEVPISYKEGSLFASMKEVMPF